MERPLTGTNRVQSKLERPRSRRGLESESLTTNAGSYRFSTSARNMQLKTPSASASASTYYAANPNSRLTTMSSSGLGDPSSMSLTGCMNINLFERPVTQQGMAGIRPGTSRTLPMASRQIQDKRYYSSVLQLKIKQLTKEISMVMNDIDNQNKERTTFLHYDKRAKDLATELTSLQGALAEYNIVVGKMQLNVGREAVEMEARDIKLKNDYAMMEIERKFEHRRKLESELSKMQKQLRNEEQKTERLIESMDANSKEKYNQLSLYKVELQEQINRMQQVLYDLSNEEAQLESEIEIFPLKHEIVKLNLKIIEAEEKREKLKEEEKTRLSPEEEKEELLEKIKQANIDIAAAEAQIIDKKRRIKTAEQELEQLETEIEDIHTEKQIKYKELRKREDVIEQFINSFEQCKLEEEAKLKTSQEAAVKILSSLASILNIDFNFSPLNTGFSIDVDALQNVLTYSNNANANYNDNFDELKREYLKQKQFQRQMEMLKRKSETELKELFTKIGDRENMLRPLENVDSLQATSEIRHKVLESDCERLKMQKPLRKQELTGVQTEYDEILQQMRNNEVFLKISTLENKLEKLKDNRTMTEEFLNKEKQRFIYSRLKIDVFDLIDKYNTMLRQSLKSLY